MNFIEVVFLIFPAHRIWKVNSVVLQSRVPNVRRRTLSRRIQGTKSSIPSPKTISRRRKILAKLLLLLI